MRILRIVIWLLVLTCFNHLEKYEFVNGKDDIPYMGLSENRVYSQWNSHLIGIMISKTSGFRGTQHFQTHPYEMEHHPLHGLKPPTSYYTSLQQSNMAGCSIPNQKFGHFGATHGTKWHNFPARHVTDDPRLPSGELTFCYGKSPFLMGKSTINGHFQLLC